MGWIRSGFDLYPFRVQLGSGWGPDWIRVGFDLSSTRVRFAFDLDSFWNRLWFDLGRCPDLHQLWVICQI